MKKQDPTIWKATPFSSRWIIEEHSHPEAAPDELLLTIFDRSAYENMNNWRYKRLGKSMSHPDERQQLYPVFVKREEARRHGFTFSDEPRRFRHLSERRIKKARKQAALASRGIKRRGATPD